MESAEQNIPYFNFFVTPISGEKVAELLSKVVGGIVHFTDVNTEEWKSNIVNKETHLFNYKSPLENLENIQTEDESIDESNIHTLENANNLKKINSEYFASRKGILVRYDKIIKFIPISYNGICKIKVSEDKKIATAKFYPASTGGIKLAENDVIGIIRKNDISVNLEMIEIHGALDYINKNNEILDDVVVARGKEPKMGKEGWTEYLFDTNRKTGPIIDENGNIDFHNLNLIESVSENQKVGIFHPMQEGEDGYNVFGEKIIPPKLVKIGKPPKGKNIYYTEEEPFHALSKVDGYIALIRGEIVISNIYNIRGDVDFHTGNIVSKGSLNVTGNVKTGFSLDMSQTIKIGGYVKDSKLKSGGDITIRGGFSGTGEGKIISGGNVTVRYIRNQIVYSRGDISAEKEVVKAKLFAKGDIKSLSNNMLLIGGHARAGGDLIVKSLGHEYGMETIVEVGYDYEIIAQIKKYDKLHAEMLEDLVRIKKQIETTLAGGVVSRLTKALLIKQKNMKNKYEILKIKRKELKEAVAVSSGSKVEVTGNIYPGVQIFIDGYKFKVTELMKSKIFTASTVEEGIVVTNR